MRIVAGRWKGRHLTVPRAGVRPTSDRVREAIFNTLPGYGCDPAGLAVLDLYAGSGALGLEALSRGASEVLLVDADRRAGAVIRRNIAALRASAATVRVTSVAALTRTEPRVGGYDLVLADPPYDVLRAELAETLHRLAAAGWFASAAVLVVETARRGEGSPWPQGIVALTERDYGDTRVWYGQARTSEPADEE